MLTLLLACTGPDVDSASGADTDTPTDDTGPSGQDTDAGWTVADQDCSGGSGWEPGHGFLVSNGGSAYFFVPESGTDCSPMVFWGHGGNNAGTANNSIWNDPLHTGLVRLADEQGFVLVVPGVEEGGDGMHEWGDEPERLNRLDAFVEEAWASADLDRNRTWFIGQSAGGHMSCYLGLYQPDPWDAVAVISAGLGGYFDYPSVEPDPKLPFFVAHDPDDQVVPYSYSEQLVSDLGAHGHHYECQDDCEMGGNGHSWSKGLSHEIVTWFGTL